MKRFLLLVVLLFLAAPAWAAGIWNVASDDSLDAANTGATAGDSVKIAAGTYTVGIEPANHGSIGAPIVYIGSVADSGAAQVASITLERQYIHILGLGVTGGVSVPASAAGHDSLYMLKVLGGFTATGWDSSYVSHCSIGNDTGGDLFTLAVDEATPDSCSTLLFDSNLFSLCGHASSHVTYMSNVVRSTFSSNDWNLRIAVTADTDVGFGPRYGIKGCSFTDNHWEFRNDKATATANGFVYRDSCRGNTVLRDTFEVHPSSTSPVGYRFSQTGSWNRGNTNNSWTDCFFRASGSCEFFNDIARYYTFQGNVFISAGTFNTYAASGDTAMDNCTFRHNTFVNTIVNSPVFGDRESPRTNTVMRSNIFYGNAVNSYGMVQWPSSGVTAANSDSNLYFSPGGSTSRVHYAGDAYSLSAWYTASGEDANSRWYTPAFNDSSWAGGDGLPLADSVYSSFQWKDGYVGAKAAASTGHTISLVQMDYGGVPERQPTSTLVDSGTVVTVSDSLYSGYRFWKWTHNFADTTAVSTDRAYSFVMHDSNIYVFAYTDPLTHTLTYTAGANGSIVGTSPQTVAHLGNGTTVVATPDAGYSCSSPPWSDGYPFASRQDLSVTADVTVTASFVASDSCHYLLVGTLPYGAGAVSRSIAPDSCYLISGSPAGYAVTDTVELTAVPATGYSFNRWVVDGSSVYENPTTAVMDAGHTVTAYFDTIWVDLTYIAGEGGRVDGDTLQTIQYGRNGTSVLAVPNSGWYFSQWDDYLETALRTDKNVRADRTATALFVPITSFCQLTYRAETGGSILPAADTLQLVTCGTAADPVTATPATGYRFRRWVNASGDSISASALRWDTPTASPTYYAQFSAITYTASYTAGVGGSITGTAYQTVSYGGSASKVTATPWSGYHFVSWSDGLTTASRTDTGIYASFSRTATFAADYVAPQEPPTVVRNRARISDCR